MNQEEIADIAKDLNRFREKYRAFNLQIQQHHASRDWCTPNRVLYRRDPVELREFLDAPDPDAVPVLIVYSHVNRPDVIDLDPEHSMVRGLINTGNRVFLLDWLRTSNADRLNDLSLYVIDAIGDALGYVAEITGFDRVNLVGICQGGTFALCHACLRPDRVGKLGLVVTPVDFHAGNSLIRHWSRNVDFHKLVENPVNIPGDLITMMFRAARPFDELGRHVRQIEHAGRNPDFGFSLRMDQWVHDCPDQPGRAFAQFMEELYCRNRLVSGKLVIRGETVDLSSLEVPVLNAFAERDHLVPWESSKALSAYIDPRKYAEVKYCGGHIGLIVSSRAQKTVHPTIGRWLSS